MKTIALTRGKIALVDDADHKWLTQWKWYANQKGSSRMFYAMRSVGGRSNRRIEQMHRLILGLQADDGQQCDHRDGDGLNNQRTNLRTCTVMQNQQCSRKRKIGSSKYKGVCWCRRDHKWRSDITLSKKLIWLGSFNSEVEAAHTYDVAALKYFGEFAMTNEMLGLLNP